MFDPGTIGVDPLVAYSAAPGKVGELATYDHATYGRQILRLVKNATGGGTAIAANVVASFASGSSQNVALAAAAAQKSKVAGFTQVAIPDNYYAYVVVDGDCGVISNAAIAADAPIAVAGAAGKIDDTAIGAVADLHAVIGRSVGSAAGIDETIRVRAKLL